MKKNTNKKGTNVEIIHIFLFPNLFLVVSPKYPIIGSFTASNNLEIKRTFKIFFLKKLNFNKIKKKKI